jgi:hypothetical protein
MLVFLRRCKLRLERLGFLEKDDLYRATDKAHSAMQGLFMEAHYESIGHGVWKTTEEQSGSTGPTDQGQSGNGSTAT